MRISIADRVVRSHRQSIVVPTPDKHGGRYAFVGTRRALETLRNFNSGPDYVVNANKCGVRRATLSRRDV